MKHLWCLLEPELRSVNCQAQSGGIYIDPPHTLLLPPRALTSTLHAGHMLGYTDYKLYHTRN